MSQVPWEFDKNKAVLLVIDMQNDFVNEGAGSSMYCSRRSLSV